MNTDHLLHTLHQIDIRLTEITRTHSEEEITAIQRDIIRALDTCLYYTEHENSLENDKKSNYFNIIRTIHKEVVRDYHHHTNVNENVYEIQKTSMLNKIEKLKNNILPHLFIKAA